MEFGDPVLEELLEVVRRDLEDVISQEVNKIRMTLGCVDAKIFTDWSDYVELQVKGGLVVDLPSVQSFYVHKLNMYEAILFVEVYRDSMQYTIARIYLWFIKDSNACYMDVVILTQHINDLAQAIIYDMKVWGEESGEA